MGTGTGLEMGVELGKHISLAPELCQSGLTQKKKITLCPQLFSVFCVVLRTNNSAIPMRH